MRKKLRKSQRRAALDLLRRARKARNCELESVAQEQLHGPNPPIDGKSMRLA
ncbi:MAG: hypothetical protein ACLP6W_03525 [Bryobacteraceae bacterium]